MVTGSRVRGVAAALLLVAGGALGIGAAALRDAAAYAGRIYPGVAIGGVSAGGLTPEDAAEALQPVVERRLHASLVVRLADREVTLTYAEAGLHDRLNEAIRDAYALGRTGSLWQRARARATLATRGAHIAIPFEQDVTRLNRLLAALAAELDAAPQDAVVTVEGGVPHLIAPGRPGQALDVEATARRIIEAMGAGSAEVAAAVTVVRPAFTTEEAQAIRAPLAVFTTKMAANPNRTHNIALASGFIRGLIVPPGGVFSYNKTVGPRTLERGFKPAPVLVDDELVPGDGGGICQVSSTLFNVALLSDFAIVSRTNHSRPVAYLPAGRDATVVYGALDLAFRNTTDAHVLLWTEVRGGRLTISAFGAHAAGRQIAVVVDDRRAIPPPAGTVTKRDPELLAGTTTIRDAQAGLRVKTYRVVTADGVVVRRELIGTSYYRPVPRTIKVGTKRVDASEPRR